MAQIFVFTPDGEVHEMVGFPSSMQYADSYAYDMGGNYWYKCWGFAGLHWSPINTSDAPRNHLNYIKTLKLIT
jgi:hypothetical protein